MGLRNVETGETYFGANYVYNITPASLRGTGLQYSLFDWKPKEIGQQVVNIVAGDKHKNADFNTRGKLEVSQSVDPGNFITVEGTKKILGIYKIVTEKIKFEVI